MFRVVKVKFKNSGRVYFFDALDFEIHKGDGVIVETARGNMLGDAVAEIEDTPEEKLVAPLKPVIRLAEEEDFEQLEYYRSKEPEAAEICREKIEEHGLAMKLVDVEYAYNGSKLTFYFTADNRVDFRELLKDLTSIFKTRIDLRQIGDRDEAKKCGGLGFCGRPICCNSFLNDFSPVSIKMAKSQNLSLIPVKISGICGKLMCCLRYEYESYESMQKQMPKIGKEFETPDGIGVVLENNIITEMTKLKVTLADGTLDVRSYPFRELVPVTAPDEAETPAEKPEQKATEPEETVETADDKAAETESKPEEVNGNADAGSSQEQAKPKSARPNFRSGRFNGKAHNNRPHFNQQKNDPGKAKQPNPNVQQKKDNAKPRQVY